MDHDYAHNAVSSDSDDDQLAEQIAIDKEKYRNGRPAENVFK